MLHKKAVDGKKVRKKVGKGCMLYSDRNLSQSQTLFIFGAF